MTFKRIGATGKPDWVRSLERHAVGLEIWNGGKFSCFLPEMCFPIINYLRFDQFSKLRFLWQIFEKGGGEWVLKLILQT